MLCDTVVTRTEAVNAITIATGRRPDAILNAVQPRMPTRRPTFNFNIPALFRLWRHRGGAALALMIITARYAGAGRREHFLPERFVRHNGWRDIALTARGILNVGAGRIAGPLGDGRRPPA